MRGREQLISLPWCGPVVHSQAPGDPMQPGSNGGFVSQRMRLASQRQKHFLKGIFGVVPMVQKMKHQVQDHRAMPTQQLSEGAGV